MIQAHSEFENVSLELMMFNITFLSESNLLTPILRLESSPLRVIQQPGELIYPIQTAMLGRVQTSLIRPSALLSILKNVNFLLPTGYNLAAVVRCESSFPYYELIKSL
jgi:hypothetical protein